MCKEEENKMWSQSFLASPHFSSPPKLSLFSSSSSSSHLKIHKFICFTQNPSSSTIDLNLTKRHFNLSILTLFFNGFLLDKAKSITDLKRYTDSINGFTLLIPTSWIKVDKAGANALFEEPNSGSNNIGIVVSPVRIKSLDQFGSPQFVADKLINAEKRKTDKPENPLDDGTRLLLEQVLHSFDALPLT